jgi:hypothetical protein
MPASDSTRVNTQLEAAIKALLFDQPIAYHPAIAHAVGSVTAGVLLSQLLYWTPRSTDPDGWVWKTQEQLHAETGLTRKEQESARRYLRDADVLEERKAGVPAKLYFRINVERLTQLLAAVQDAQNGQTRMPKMGNQERPDGAHKSAQIVHAISEITTETTAEITNRDPSTSVDGNPSNSKVRTRKKFQERAREERSGEPSKPVRIGELLPPPPARPSTSPTAKDTSLGRAERAEKAPLPSKPAQSTTRGQTGRSRAISGAQATRQTPVGEALTDEQLAALTATMQTLSEKLGDDRHWRSNVSQARHILEASGLNPNAWTGLVWSVYHRTAEQQGRLKRPMAWFFRALRNEVAERTSPKSLHATFATDPPRKSLAGQYEHLVRR